MKNKNLLVAALLMIATSLVLTSCEKEEEQFDYPMETLYGTWVGTGICYDGNYWYDLTDYRFEKFGFSITFYSDGSYYGKGSFGTGSGTYEAIGKTITTYVDGEVYFKYEVINLSKSSAELIMYDRSGDSAKIRVKKK
jgi:hypothetical protein